MSVEKRLLTALTALLIALAQAQAAQYSTNVTIRPLSPTAGWVQGLEPLDSANFTVKVIKKESGYQLKSGPTVFERWGAYGVIWALSGSSDSSSEVVMSFYVMNTSPEVAKSKVVVSCVWGPIPGEGSGEGTPLEDKYGWATGLVNLAVGDIRWSFQPESRLRAAHTNIVYQVWVVNAQDDIVNTTFNFQVSSVNVNPYASWAIIPDHGDGPVLNGNVTANGGSRGNLRADYTYFGYPKHAFSSNLTFVAIEKMQYKLTGAWTDVTDATIYAAHGTNIEFRVYPKPSDAPWPAGKPVWTGASGAGSQASNTFTQVGTNLVTAECGNTVTGKVVVIKIDFVEAYCNKFGASGSFGVNPEIFAGGQTDFGQPDQPPPYWWLPGTYENPASKVLKVFFKYVKDANDEPGAFDIDLKANIYPESILDNDAELTWLNWAGPSASGSFDKTDEKEVKFQNPTKGGLYKFRIEMQLPGCAVASDAWALLPKAGGEISGWMVTEVPSLITRAQNWETAVRAVAISNGINEEVFLETAWKAIATCDFDYQGIVGSPTKRYSFRDSDRPAGHTSDPSIPGMAGDKGNGDWDEPSFATLRGIVVSRAKLNNTMYAVWGRNLGYSENQLKAGAFWNAMSRGLWDDSTSQNAVELGSDLYDEYDGGGDLSSVITKPRAQSIQSPDTPSGLNDVNLWPDTTTASGFWLPTMPTDYDSLDEGENEIPRGRLF